MNKMTRGKLWSKEEEQKVRLLYQAGNPDYIIAAQMGRTKDAIRQKLMRLGLKEVVHHSSACTTTTKHTPPPPLPEELPTIEEALKILATALRLAHTPNLSPVEIKRLYTITKLAKTYKDLLADYIDYRTIENKLIEMEEKYAKLVQESQSLPSTTDRSNRTPTPTQ